MKRVLIKSVLLGILAIMATLVVNSRAPIVNNKMALLQMQNSNIGYTSFAFYNNIKCWLLTVINVAILLIIATMIYRTVKRGSNKYE